LTENQPISIDTTSIVELQGTDSRSSASIPESGVGKKVENQKSEPPIATPAKPTTSFSFNYPTARVEGGTFLMGSPEGEKDRRSDECQHSVTVRSFSMGKYEVTQVQWRSVMGKNSSYHKNCDDCPVEQVSWNDVQAFIKTLNGKSTKDKQYRLPTEAEWEYAARGGNKAAGVTKIYAGSNDIDGVAWYNGNSDSEPHPVGGKNPNDLGLHDMSGNVWEWCQDLYNAYPGCKAIDTGGRGRVIRGGGWNSAASDCRAAYRNSREPAFRNRSVGFRLVSVSLQ